jgi:hypothetical protein
MAYELEQYEGKRFCVVFVKVTEKPDGAEPDFQVRCVHGRANIERGMSLVLEHDGGRFVVPRSCYNRILASDGTAMLKDAEFFVMCKVEGMEL